MVVEVWLGLIVLFLCDCRVPQYFVLTGVTLVLGLQVGEVPEFLVLEIHFLLHLSVPGLELLDPSLKLANSFSLELRTFLQCDGSGSKGCFELCVGVIGFGFVPFEHIRY